MTPRVTGVEPYLFFGGRCEEAIAHYQQALGAELLFLMRNADNPAPPPTGVLPPDFGQKVLHASVRLGSSVVLMSDGDAADGGSFQGFSLSLDCPDADAARAAFDALADGGEVRLDLTPTFWAPLFGMVRDRFGVGWMLTVPAPVPTPVA